MVSIKVVCKVLQLRLVVFLVNVHGPLNLVHLLRLTEEGVTDNAAKTGLYNWKLIHMFLYFLFEKLFYEYYIIIPWRMLNSCDYVRD